MKLLSAIVPGRRPSAECLSSWAKLLQKERTVADLYRRMAARVRSRSLQDGLLEIRNEHLLSADQVDTQLRLMSERPRPSDESVLKMKSSGSDLDRIDLLEGYERHLTNAYEEALESMVLTSRCEALIRDRFLPRVRGNQLRLEHLTGSLRAAS